MDLKCYLLLSLQCAGDGIEAEVLASVLDGVDVAPSNTSNPSRNEPRKHTHNGGLRVQLRGAEVPVCSARLAVAPVRAKIAEFSSKEEGNLHNLSIHSFNGHLTGRFALPVLRGM